MRIWLCSGRAVTMVLAVPTTIPQPPLIEETWWVRVAFSLCGERLKKLVKGKILSRVETVGLDFTTDLTDN